MIGHGFRNMASTLLNEMGWRLDAIERQLAHAEKDGGRAAYNRAEHLPEHRRMINRGIKDAFLSNANEFLSFMAKTETDPGFGKIFFSEMFKRYEQAVNAPDPPHVRG